MELSDRILNVEASQTMAINDKANLLRAQGKNIIGFNLGEPDFDTPEFIKMKAIEGMEKGYTSYTNVSGLLQLREEICNKYKREYNLLYSPEQVIVSNGAKQILYNVLQTIINPGDEVIIIAPYWVSYPEMIKLAGGKPVVVHTKEENDLKAKVQDIKSKISKKVKAIILNSPGNPGGGVYTKNQLSEISNLVVDNNLLMISDEIYEKFQFNDNKYISIATLGEQIKARTIVVNAMSKTYAMTGWRIGFAAGPENIIRKMGIIQGHSTSNANSIAQYASWKGLANRKLDLEIKRRADEYKERCDIMINKINKIPLLNAVKPVGAFYVFLNIKETYNLKYQDYLINDSLSFAKALLEGAGVAVVPGIAFGMDGYVRLTFASSREDINVGLERIERFIKKISV